MADVVDAGAADEPDRRTRPASMSSEGIDHDHDHDDKPIECQALAPSPARSAGHALEEPPRRRAPSRRSRPMRMFQSMCRSLPLLNPRCGRQLQPGACRIATPARLTPSDSLLSQLMGSSSSAAASRHRLTGTLFGYRDGRVSLSLQDNARCRPTLVVELALPTHALLRELGAHAGARIVLESEKHADSGDTADATAGAAGVGGASFKRHDDDDGWVLEEPMWTMFCNGKRVGYAVRREPTDEDIAVLETLWAVTMGGGVLPGRSDVDGPDGEMAYMRGSFEHTVGSRDSESLYMVGPPGGDGPELAIFFVRL
ncbi:hypothetical protein SEVIR_7G267900v4 [Setaria viridis]|uniref:Protein MIZU-KUSSEI 1 n=1 Tax=Setaria viridis TaxID=4556 RepID=A0A4U6TYI2_SETVI|nr:protein MIZU-KUSSEI 1-like [Setaria viridis]TKW06855.1 hypothetical protein SEVIR_7G267900v2 [Setaria viridis]